MQGLRVALCIAVFIGQGCGGTADTADSWFGQSSVVGMECAEASFDRRAIYLRSDGQAIYELRMGHRARVYWFFGTWRSSGSHRVHVVLDWQEIVAYPGGHGEFLGALRMDPPKHVSVVREGPDFRTVEDDLVPAGYVFRRMPHFMEEAAARWSRHAAKALGDSSLAK